jgi:hypothetical protein
MNITAEIGEGGVLLIKSPDAKPGDQFQIPVQQGIIPPENLDWWSSLQQAFNEADQLDFPRRSYEDLMTDLHEQRG